MLHWRVGQRALGLAVFASWLGGSLPGCGGKVVDDTLVPGGSAAGPSASAPGSNSPGGSPPSSFMLPQRETCEDNPLLAGCTERSAPAPPDVPPAMSTTPGLSPLASVQQLLVDRCGKCHGGPPSTYGCSSCGGLYDIESLQQLIQGGMVVPCHWQDSPLYQRMADGSMPPPGTGAGLSTSERTQVGDFVDGLCSGLTTDNLERPSIERTLAADCGSCHGFADAGAVPEPSRIDGKGDIEELIESGLIVPCNAVGSELVRVLRDDSMPPPYASGPRPSPAELRRLSNFIDRPCKR